MNQKQKRFAEEYLVDLNATQAAIRAGYSKKTGYAQGHRLLKDAEVATYIEKRLEEESGATRRLIINELVKHAFADVSKFVEWGPGRFLLKDVEDMADDDVAAVQEVYVDGQGSIRLKLVDKQSALDKLARIAGLYQDKVLHQGDPDAPVAVQITRKIVDSADNEHT